MKDATYNTKACMKYVDSAYLAFPNPGIEDLYRKYSFKRSLVLQHNNDFLSAKIYCDSMLLLFNAYPEQDERLLKLHSMAYLGLGEVLIRMKRFEEAFAAYHQGRLLIEQIKNACEAQSMYSSQVGTGYYLQGDYKEAITFYRKSISQLTDCKSDDPFSTPWNTQGLMDNIGLCYDKLGQLDSAQFYFQAALDFLDKKEIEFPDPFLLSAIDHARGVIYGNLGDMYLKDRDTVMAETMWKASAAINLKNGSQVKDGQITQAKLINHYMAASRFEDASHGLQALRESLDAFRNEAMEIRYYYLSWQYHQSMKELPDAYRSLVRYRELEDSVTRLQKAREPDIEKELRLLEYEHQKVLHDREDNLKTTYLALTAGFLILITIILLLIWRNAKRVQKHNEDMQRILKVVAHDLRSPINGMLGLSNILLYETNRSADDLKLLEMIRGSAQHSIKLITEILSLDFDESLKENELEIVDLRPFLHQIVDLLQFSASEKKQVLELVGNGNAKARISRDKIFRVVHNLIGNALKFSPPGSVIKISLEQTEESIIMAVIDQGIGIPPEMGDTIFDVFTKGKRPGTSGEKSFGLGLSISRKIIMAHKGNIWYVSNSGKGTTFYVKIPMN